MINTHIAIFAWPCRSRAWEHQHPSDVQHQNSCRRKRARQEEPYLFKYPFRWASDGILSFGIVAKASAIKSVLHCAKSLACTAFRPSLLSNWPFMSLDCKENRALSHSHKRASLSLSSGPREQIPLFHNVYSSKLALPDWLPKMTEGSLTAHKQ